MIGSREKCSTRCGICSRNAFSGSPAAMRMRTTRTASPTTRIHKLLLGRDPIAGASLASQPTISRFENRVGVQELYAIGRELATTVIERHQRRLHGRVRRITIDLDPTDDPTHGAQ